MFTQKKTDTGAVSAPSMLVATVDTLPGQQYTVVGLVATHEYCGGDTPKFDVVQQRLTEQAREMGADAVIGVRFTQSQMPNKHLLLLGSGTAIKFS
jgi:hypothetical protein